MATLGEYLAKGMDLGDVRNRFFVDPEEGSEISEETAVYEIHDATSEKHNYILHLTTHIDGESEEDTHYLLKRGDPMKKYRECKDHEIAHITGSYLSTEFWSDDDPADNLNGHFSIHEEFDSRNPQSGNLHIRLR